MFQDFNIENQLHLERANNPLPSSTPEMEPWYDGPPQFTYYTQVEIPFHLLNCNFTTDPDCTLPNTIYIPSTGTIKSPIIHLVIGRIIGKNGYFLKYLTEITGLHYIWYNQSNTNTWGVFELWGSPDKLPYACYLLNQRIESIINYY